MNEKDDPRSLGNMPYRPNDGQQLPPWMQADKISLLEKMEITLYKIVTYIPVAITFGVFTFLFSFYSTVSIPTFLINFQIVFSLPLNQG